MSLASIRIDVNAKGGVGHGAPWINGWLSPRQARPAAPAQARAGPRGRRTQGAGTAGTGSGSGPDHRVTDEPGRRIRLVALIEEAAGSTGNRPALPGVPELDCHEAIELG